MKDLVAIVEQAEVSEQQLIDAATNAIAAEFWTVGWAASEWVKLGKSEQEFADRVGLSQQSINQKRRVHERFKDLTNRLVNLSFTHFVKALEFDKDPEDWLEEANELKQSVRQMELSYKAYYTPSNHEPEPEPSPAQQQLHEFFDGDSEDEDDETVEASDESTPSDESESATGPEQTTPPASPSIVQDKLKNDVPAKLLAAWDQRHELTSTGKSLDKIKRGIFELCDKPGCEFVDFQEIERTVKHLKDEIVRSAYYATCPHCHGDGCEKCKGHGYYPEKYKNHLQTEVAK